MPELARSLVEAYVHLDLVAEGAAREPVVQDAEGLLVRRGGVEVLVPYEAESAAREYDLTFGSGLSELIDPGQWAMIAATYASRALEGALFLAADPSDSQRFDEVATGWRFAADAVAEALKFFPPGAADLPPDAFWSGAGRSLRDTDPERVTRRRLENDLAFYRKSLDDFHRLHTRP